VSNSNQSIGKFIRSAAVASQFWIYIGQVRPHLVIYLAVTVTTVQVVNMYEYVCG